MPSALHLAIGRVSEGRHLTAEETAAAFGDIMRGEATPALIAGLLVGLRAKGETADEIAGAARALRDVMVRVQANEGAPLVDTCGTGGGRVNTLNLSTAAGFVAAGAGARVAKHGNRSYTSKCGSADVLEALGVDIGIGADRAADLLDRVGLVFLFAPNYHPAMRHVGPIRKELGVATIMNLLGPLANPAGVRRQVVGVADRARAPLIAEALVRLEAEHALVVHGEVGMDEVSPAGRSTVWEVKQNRVTTWTLDPTDYGLAWDRTGDLHGGTPEENAVRLERLLEPAPLGRPTGADEGARRAVVLNAAAGILVSGLADSYAEATRTAAAAIQGGKASSVLERLRMETGAARRR
ncbi:MAG TPA: anthranilate phosphoribosyltransferase [Gemmatimonadales bacterium]|nr:anthranilate phosphoribosyltransferase [Gemmatimonadales bacterium]